ncbi:MAG: hypothetical protein HF978_11880 [Desulfobacteraceae bacterium]|nr:SCP2 sterol-binding domain-containing protein [Desulfobacteraceae bacterium]MBC2756237.1 hypothetical protein [Desulfobacteraceae bacterium]
MLVFTKEWIEALAASLRENEKYQKSAKGFNSTFQFVVESVPKKGVTKTKSCGLKTPECEETWEGIKTGADFTMTASYETYYKICTGKMNAIVAMTTRKAKVKGNMVKLLKYTSATNNFVEAIQQLPNEFEGDFADM